MYVLSISEETNLIFVYLFMYIFELISLCNTDIKCQGNQFQFITLEKWCTVTVLFVSDVTIITFSGQLAIISAIANVI